MAMSSITVKGIVPSLLILGGFQDFIYDQPTSIFRTTNNFIPTISIPSITNWELRNNNLSGFRWVHNTDFGDTTGELNLQSFVNNLSIGNNIVLIDQDLNFQIVSRLVIPFGDNNRPLAPKVGTLRVNTVSNNLEFYTDQWRNAGGGTGGTGTVTSITAGTGLTGGTITDSGTIALANTAVTAGTYNYATVTVDAQGRITNAIENEIEAGTVTSITAGTGLTGGTITDSGTISIANTTVTAGTYNYATLTVNAQGQLISASSGSPVTSITAGTGLTGGIITSTGAIALSDTTVTAGIYNYATITVDAQGRITNAIENEIEAGTVTSITAGTGLTGGTITDSGTIALANTAVTAGSYNYANITVDAQGRLTNAVANTTPVNSVTGTANQIVIGGTATAPVIGFVSNPTVPGTSYISIPTGTTAQRPTTPSLGMIRINTSL